MAAIPPLPAVPSSRPLSEVATPSLPINPIAAQTSPRLFSPPPLPSPLASRTLLVSPMLSTGHDEHTHSSMDGDRCISMDICFASFPFPSRILYTMILSHGGNERQLFVRSS